MLWDMTRFILVAYGLRDQHRHFLTPYDRITEYYIIPVNNTKKHGSTRKQVRGIQEKGL